MEALLTVDEVAARLQVPKGTVYALSRRKAIPVKRVGRLIRFDRDEIELWLEGRRSK